MAMCRQPHTHGHVQAAPPVVVQAAQAPLHPYPQEEMGADWEEECQDDIARPGPDPTPDPTPDPKRSLTLKPKLQHHPQPFITLSLS